MPQDKLQQLIEDIEGMVYGRLVDSGINKQRAIHVSLRASVRVGDMVKDAG